MAVTEKRVHTIESEVGRIAQRVAKLEGHNEGTIRALHGVSEKSPSATLITLLGILGAGLMAYLGWLGVEVVSQGRQISQILSILSPEIIRKAAAHPENPKSVKQVRDAVRKAMKGGERYDPEIISEAGSRFADASRESPAAWDAAISLLDYRSFLNVSYPRPEPVKLLDSKIAYYTWFTAMPSLGKTYTLGVSRPPNVAEVHAIGAPDENANLGLRPTFFLITEARLKLDGTVMKNVIIKDSQVDYYGGPIVLENVYFVNCTFAVMREPHGVELAKGIFAANPAVNLTTS